jgi:hypothetical protein
MYQLPQRIEMALAVVGRTERKWYNVAMARSPWSIYPRPRAQPRRLTWRSVIVSLFTLLGRFVGDLTTGRSSRASGGTQKRSPRGK